MDQSFKILVVDDKESYCEVLTMVLESGGYTVTQCMKAEEAVQLIEKTDFDLVISDLIMPGMDGIELLNTVKRIKPDLFFIITTAFGTIDNAVEAMRQGAFTYIVKGSDPEKLLAEVAQIQKLIRIKKAAHEKPDEGMGEFMMNTKSPLYKDVLDMAGKSAKSDANVLILGESGSGKEIIAKYIHANSKRSKKQFLATNCHTFADSLLDAELFGHEKGAFTGALNSRIGRFEAAAGGSLFLDEIGDTPLTTQAKLLRAIETKSITRIGKNEEIQVDFRLITATNKNLEEEIKKNAFREDLFFRISTIIIQVPPLRRRKEDIPALIDHFLRKAQFALDNIQITMEPCVMDFLLKYSYPGNVRELRNIVERLVVLSDEGTIGAKHIEDMMAKNESEQKGMPWEGSYSLKELRREVESKYIENQLKKNNNHISKTAKDLGISARHLFNKMNEYGIRSGHNEEESFDDC